MSLKIYADLMSQPSRALVLFCRAAKVPHEFKQLMLKNGDHLTPEMTKLNPFQKVNVFKIAQKSVLDPFQVHFKSILGPF